MPTFEVTSPNGRILEIDGPAMPTEAELDDIFAAIPSQDAQRRRGAQAVNNKESLTDKVIGGIDAAGSIARNIIADPVTGVAGMVGSIVGGPEMGGDVVNFAKEKLHSSAFTEQGKQTEAKIGEALAPVGDAFQNVEQFLGEEAYKRTGSPTVAAAATAFPTLATELLGIGSTKSAINTGKRGSRAIKENEITRSIKDAAPSTDQLKNTSRAIYKELDEAGVTVNPDSYNQLVSNVQTNLIDNGLDPILTPKATQVLKRLSDDIGKPLTLSNVDQLRKIAKNSASSLDPADASLGNIIIDSIDEFLDNPGNFSGQIANVGERYRVARDLWGRAKRSEILDGAVERAKTQASGFENGIRRQFDQIIKNKKASRFFSKDEIKEMQKVVNGTRGANLAKFFGKFGYTDGQTANIVGGSVGVLIGTSVGGGAGAVLVPLIGIASKSLAHRLTKGNAHFANQVIRAGTNAREITKAYFRNTSPKNRSAQELSQLLMRGDIDLSSIPDSEIARNAAAIANERRAALSAGAISGSAASQNQEQ